MHIHIFNDQKILEISEDLLVSSVQIILEKKKIHIDELSIHLVDDKAIGEIHAQFFDDPTPTDCISFPIDPPGSDGHCYLGEIFISTETAKRYAIEHNIPVKKELILYLVHGLLHLLGYDDIEEKELTLMREQEEICMQYLQDIL